VEPKGLISRRKAATIVPRLCNDVLVFDGTCGFCTRALDLIMRRRRPDGIILIPYQWLSEAALSGFGTCRERCDREVYLLRANDGPLAGALALNELCRTLPLVGGAVATMTHFSALVNIEQCVYAWIARNRSIISWLLGTAKYALLHNGEEG